MTKSSISRSCSMLIYNFLRKVYIDFQSVCTSLYSYQQWRRVPLIPHSFQQKERPVIKSNKKSAALREISFPFTLSTQEKEMPKDTPKSKENLFNISKLMNMQLKEGCTFHTK